MFILAVGLLPATFSFAASDASNISIRISEVLDTLKDTEGNGKNYGLEGLPEDLAAELEDAVILKRGSVNGLKYYIIAELLGKYDEEDPSSCLQGLSVVFINLKNKDISYPAIHIEDSGSFSFTVPQEGEQFWEEAQEEEGEENEAVQATPSQASSASATSDETEKKISDVYDGSASPSMDLLAAEPSEAASPEPTLSEAASPEPTLSEAASPEPTLSEAASPEPTLSEAASPEPTLSEAAPPEPTQSEAAPPEPAQSEAAPSEPAPSEAAPSEPVPSEAVPPESEPSEAGTPETMPTATASSASGPTATASSASALTASVVDQESSFGFIPSRSAQRFFLHSTFSSNGCVIKVAVVESYAFVANVHVLVRGVTSGILREGYTDQTGTVTFSGLGIDDYEVTCIDKNRWPEVMLIKFDKEEVKNCELNLDRPYDSSLYSIYMRISDANTGKSLKGAAVSVKGLAGSENGSKVTNDFGIVTFELQQPDSVEIAVVMPGYLPYTEIRPKQTSPLHRDIGLTPLIPNRQDDWNVYDIGGNEVGASSARSRRAVRKDVTPVTFRADVPEGFVEDIEIRLNGSSYYLTAQSGYLLTVDLKPEDYEVEVILADAIASQYQAEHVEKFNPITGQDIGVRIAYVPPAEPEAGGRERIKEAAEILAEVPEDTAEPEAYDFNSPLQVSMTHNDDDEPVAESHGQEISEFSKPEKNEVKESETAAAVIPVEEPGNAFVTAATTIILAAAVLTALIAATLGFRSIKGKKNEK